MTRASPRRRSASRGISTAAFLGLLACAAVFVLWSSRGLPPRVASHFAAGGEADGFMPRASYTMSMLVAVVLVPAFVGLFPLRVFRGESQRINLPNRDYWLAPARRAETVAVLSRQTLRLGTILLLFLCYAHGLVVRGNETTPPALPMPWFLGGLAGFMVATLLCVGALIARFRDAPR